MNTQRFHFSLIVCLFIFFSCSRNDRQAGIIFSKVENLVEQYPDSALILLDSIPNPYELNANQFAQYHLLLIQAKDKCYKDISSDTIIFQVKDYYSKKKDYPNATLATFYCGRLLQEKNQVEEAATAYLEAEEFANYIEDDNLKGLIQGNISILCSGQLLNEKAIFYGKNAVAHYQKSKNLKNEIRTMFLIGNCFLFMNKNDSAFYYYNKGLQLADRYQLSAEQASARQSIAIAYQQIGNYTDALNMLHDALSFSENDSTERARIYLNIANINRHVNNVDSANYYAELSLSFQAKEPALLIATYLSLSELKEKESNYKEALQYFKKYNNSVLKIVEDNKSSSLIELKGKYDFETMKNENNRLVIKEQKILLIFSLILLGVSFLAFLFYRRYIQKERIILEAESKMESLNKMAQTYSEGNESFRNILLQQFEVLRKAAFIEREISKSDRKNGDVWIKKFNKIVEQDILNWDILYPTMNQLKNGLYDRIKGKYPQLDDIEFRLCCLSCENFDDTEIAIILKMTIYMVQKKRSVIRKKIGVPPYGNIHSFFQQNA